MASFRKQYLQEEAPTGNTRLLASPPDTAGDSGVLGLSSGGDLPVETTTAEPPAEIQENSQVIDNGASFPASASTTATRAVSKMRSPRTASA